MSDTTTTEARAVLANHLQKVGAELSAMLDYWHTHDLPGDIITGDTYPFAASLDEVVADVFAAVARIRATEHVGRVDHDPTKNYGHRPVCSCGEVFMGYAADHAAAAMLAAHIRDVEASA